LKYKTLDLFSGIGGIRRGFELTQKFINVLSAEIDKYACKTYEHLFHENPFNDVTSEVFKHRVEKLDYDVLIAGFPCQAFSSVGKKEGFRDRTRGTLFFDIADILDRTRPQAFLLENVEGLTTHQKGKTFKTILETLVLELNYKVIGVEINDKGQLEYNPRTFIRNSKDFGIPQNRPRVYIVGFDNTRFYNKISNIPFHELPKNREGKLIYKNISDILEDNVPPKYYLSEGYLQTLKKHKESQKNKGNGFGFQIINRPGIANPIASAILATGGSGKERNLIYDLNEDYIGLKVKYKKTPINSEGIRVMTPNEWAKLQGFMGYAFINEKGEDNFSFPEGMSDAQKYKQLGNSVTIPVIEEISKKIADTLDWLNTTEYPTNYTKELIQL
jgi:DNA (cytosine-5)-methyltransferase 1